MISWSSTECLGTLQSGTLSDRAQSGGHKNRIESCSWACRAIGLVFLSGATGQTARLANARLLPDRLSCQIAPDINRAIGARLARSLSSDQYYLVQRIAARRVFSTWKHRKFRSQNGCIACPNMGFRSQRIRFRFPSICSVV